MLCWHAPGAGVGDGEGLGGTDGVGVGEGWPRALTWPATTVASPSTPLAARSESVVTRYVPIGRSTKPNQPVPSVVAFRTARPLLVSTRCTTVPASALPSAATAMPRRWPKIGRAFQLIWGTGGASANTGGIAESYGVACVRALVSSVRLAAALRVPAFASVSGVR